MYTASRVSKLEPEVSITSVPSAGAVQPHQTDERGARVPWWVGSPTSAVAQAELPVTPEKLERSSRLAKLSFARPPGPSGGAGISACEPAYESRFLVQPETPRSLLGVAEETRRSDTAPGDIPGWRERISDAIPATWGAAIEVPEILFEAVGDVCQAEVIPLPGAKRSTH